MRQRELETEHWHLGQVYMDILVPRRFTRATMTTVYIVIPRGGAHM